MFDDISQKDKPFWKRTKYWSDTCDCVIEFCWDKRTSEVERVHRPFSILNACQHHENLREDMQAFHNAVIQDSVFKNTTLATILANLPEENKIVVDKDQDDNDVYWFAQEPQWIFDENRELRITLNGVSIETKTQLAALFTERVVHIT